MGFSINFKLQLSKFVWSPQNGHPKHKGRLGKAAVFRQIFVVFCIIVDNVTEHLVSVRLLTPAFSKVQKQDGQRVYPALVSPNFGTLAVRFPQQNAKRPNVRLFWKCGGLRQDFGRRLSPRQILRSGWNKLPVFVQRPRHPKVANFRDEKRLRGRVVMGRTLRKIFSNKFAVNLSFIKASILPWEMPQPWQDEGHAGWMDKGYRKGALLVR